MKRISLLMTVVAPLVAPASTSRAHSSSVGVNGPFRYTATRPGGQVIAPDPLSRLGTLATDCGASPDFVVLKVDYTAVSPWTLMHKHSITPSCGCWFRTDAGSTEPRASCAHRAALVRRCRRAAGHPR